MTQFFSHPVPAVVILLGLLVFFHEFGHFVVGRLCGIAVETFSIGFGPPIVGFKRRGTEYRLSWVPLGGYVKFAGSHPSEEVSPELKGRGFLQTSVGRRALTVLAGPFANFVLAVIVYAILGAAGVPHPPAVIGEVVEGSPAARAGLEFGDRVVQIGDRQIKTWTDIEESISSSPGKDLTITIENSKGPRTLTLRPELVKTTDMAGRPVTIGRAGISRGLVPSILSVASPQGAAAEAGVRTGDRVTGAEFLGQKHSLTYLPELARLIRIAVQKGAKQIILTIEPAPIPSAKEPSQTPPPSIGSARRVDLSLASLQALSDLGNDRALFKVLGMSGSELTVAEAADTAGAKLAKGDILIGWNGQPLRDVFSLREVLIANNQPVVKVTVLRQGVETALELPLKGVETQKPEGSATFYTLPVIFWGSPEEPEPLFETHEGLSALIYGISHTALQTRELIANIASLIAGDVPLKALGGPMLIAKVAGDSARHGWQTFLGAMALISVNLGLLNLFPIPVLDGGQLVLMGAEAVRRRPLCETAVENFQKVGFAMIMALVVLATYNDLSRFWRSMLESVVGIFQ